MTDVNLTNKIPYGSTFISNRSFTKKDFVWYNAGILVICFTAASMVFFGDTVIKIFGIVFIVYAIYLMIIECVWVLRDELIAEIRTHTELLTVLND